MVRDSVGDTHWPEIGASHQWVGEEATLRIKVLGGDPRPESRLGSWHRFLYGCPYRVNDASAVLLAEIENGRGTWRFLLTGDINGKPKRASWTEEPVESEARLLERWGDELASDVLKLAHRGSDTSSTLDFRIM